MLQLIDRLGILLSYAVAYTLGLYGVGGLVAWAFGSGGDPIEFLKLWAIGGILVTATETDRRRMLERESKQDKGK